MAHSAHDELNFRLARVEEVSQTLRTRLSEAVALLRRLKDRRRGPGTVVLDGLLDDLRDVSDFLSRIDAEKGGAR